jgi:hypothetical protein
MIECAIAALQRVLRRDEQSFARAEAVADASLPPLAVSN